MPTLHCNGTDLPLSDDGFLVDPLAWNEDVARALALDQEGVAELSKAHWAIIHFIRGFYLEHGLAPLIRYICKTTNIKLKTIFELFPSGPAKGACKVAGLPNADGCV